MKSIKTQLFLIMVVLAILPMLCVGIASMAVADSSLSGVTTRMMDNHARDILRRAEDRLSFLEEGFTEFSANTLTVEAILDSAYDYDIQKNFYNHLYTFLLSKPEVTRMLIVREDNTVFGYNASTFSPNASPNTTYRESIFTPEACRYLDSFTEEFACPDFPMYLSPLTDESSSLLICHRILSPDTYQPIATMVAHINFLESPALFDNIALWPEEEIMLQRADGTVLASSVKSAVGQVRAPIARSPAPTHTQRTEDNRRINCSGVRGRYGIEIQVSVPQSVLHQTNRRLLTILAVILAFAAALLAASFLLVKRRFFGKLGSLSNRLRENERTPLKPIDGEWGNDEIGQLVSSYNLVTNQAKEEFYKERARLERLKQLELDALQTQIKPHFLYNTLDVAVWYAKDIHADKIQNLLIKLSKYYRLSLSSGAGFIPIRHELQHALLYLEMEQLHTSRPFEVVCDVDAGVMDFFIPKITLQPIVENSVKHGIKAKESGQRIISVSGRVKDDCVELVVDDNGVGMDPQTLERILTPGASGEQGHGFAVFNVHRRITLSFGEKYGLSYQSRPGIGTSVHILLPILRDGTSALQ